jgi:hypothetical protein
LMVYPGWRTTFTRTVNGPTSTRRGPSTSVRSGFLRIEISKTRSVSLFELSLNKSNFKTAAGNPSLTGAGSSRTFSTLTGLGTPTAGGAGFRSTGVERVDGANWPELPSLTAAALEWTTNVSARTVAIDVLLGHMIVAVLIQLTARQSVSVRLTAGSVKKFTRIGAKWQRWIGIDAPSTGTWMSPVVGCVQHLVIPADD